MGQDNKPSEPELRSFISVGCNKTSNCLDWADNGLLCYGAANSVALCQFNEEESVGEVVATLHKHKKRVNCVKWVRGGVGAASELLSASSDHSVILWRLCSTSNPPLIKPISIITSHTGPVNLVDGIYRWESDCGPALPDTYIVSASADSTVKLWLRKSFQEELSCIYTVSLGGGLCLSVGLTWSTESASVLLALGLDDSNIHLHSDRTKLLVLRAHEDWVKTLHFTHTSGGDIVLASGSQDSSIRLWKLSSSQLKENSDSALSQETSLFTLNSVHYTVTLESLLLGHEGWVTSLQWKPHSDGEELVSCSTDRTVVVWGVDRESGVWLERSRLGELGGNTLGYLTVSYSPSTHRLVANSHHGALHMWTNHGSDGWKCVFCVGGHSEPVVDIDWERPEGRYVLSCSMDKTTRLFAPCSRLAQPLNKVCWFEMSRPQLHGHGMAGLAALPGFSLASASEEKVVRVFTAPHNVLHNLANLCHGISCERKVGEGGAVGATVPSLGLSNKAVLELDWEQHDDSEPQPHFTPQTLSEPPTEDSLVQNTLWPEVMKLYGHGYEVYSLAATWAGDLLATACKASSPLHAKIMLWETEDWNQVGELEGHNLTVTQMQFSPDDKKLLSVSRDRMWCLYIRTGESKEFKLLSRSDKELNAHSRIIWCCSWSYDGLYFATGSRDCKVMVWPGGSLHISSRPPASLPLTHHHPVTALSFSSAPLPPSIPPSLYLLAIGLESGTIHVYLWQPTAWTFLLTIPSHLSHGGSISRLRFRPLMGTVEREKDKRLLCQGSPYVQLASSSLDHSIRIFTLHLEHFVSAITIPNQ